jgi:hypothetical protein
MPGIKASSVQVDQAIEQHHDIPSISEIRPNIKSGAEITVHLQESREGTVDAVVKCCCVNGVLPVTAEEILLIRVVRQKKSLGKILWNHLSLPSSTEVDGGIAVASSKPSADEEVVLPKFPSALSHRRRVVSKGINCDLTCVVKPEAVNVKR